MDGVRLFQKAVVLDGVTKLKVYRIKGTSRRVFEVTKACGVVATGATQDEALYNARVAEQLAERRAVLTVEEQATVAAYTRLLYG